MSPREQGYSEWPDEPRQPGPPTKEQAFDAFMIALAEIYVDREEAAERGEAPTGPGVPSDDD